MKQLIRLVAVILVLCVFCAGIFWYMHQRHIIVKLPNGFFPKVTHLEKNDKLTFINISFSPMWPAAGPHPTHTSYPGFDPKHSILPLLFWNFTFQKEGTFTFHDHDTPEMGGVIVSGKNDLSQVTQESTCLSLSNQDEQGSCMEIFFKNIATSESYETARKTFNDIAIRYPNNCHTFAHDLGKSAYKTYLLENTLDLGQETSSCGFGFWHGFTTAMQTNQGEAATKEFCESVSGKTETLLQINRMNCYHGIGIGLIPDPPSENLFGAFQILVDPALAFCDTITGNPFNRERCLTGVFHAMTVYMVGNLYGFSFNEDSLSLCARQKREYQETCFETLIAAVPALTNFDLKQTNLIIRKSVPSTLFLNVFKMAAIIFVDAEAPIEKIGGFIEECNTISPDLRQTCIAAAINKLYNNGLPGIEYKKAINFCSSEWVLPNESIYCFNEVISYASGVYTPEKLKEVCNSMPETMRTNLIKCSN